MERHPRGVFRQSYRGPDGRDVLVAVDSQGRAVAYALAPERSHQKVVRALRSIVDAADPPTPPLHLLT